MKTDGGSVELFRLRAEAVDMRMDARELASKLLNWESSLSNLLSALHVQGHMQLRQKALNAFKLR